MKLIENLMNLPETRKTYLEILEIHDKEVPIANLLAFFFRNKEIHGLNNIFIKALLKTKFYELDVKKYPKSKGTLISLVKFEKKQQIILNSITNVEVETEVKTSKDNDENKRIDIVINTENFVICIEFKINHKLNNPLEVYKNHIENKYKNTDKQIFYIVLTPSKKEADVSNVQNYLEKNKDFKQVILSNFIKNIQSELPLDFKGNSSFNYYNDFIQTIQNREIRYKRSLLLERLSNSFNNQRIKSEYIINNKGGYIQIKKINHFLKIRIENKKFQVEKWNQKKEKIILDQFDLNTDLDDIVINTSNY